MHATLRGLMSLSNDVDYSHPNDPNIDVCRPINIYMYMYFDPYERFHALKNCGMNISCMKMTFACMNKLRFAPIPFRFSYMEFRSIKIFVAES